MIRGLNTALIEEAIDGPVPGLGYSAKTRLAVYRPSVSREGFGKGGIPTENSPPLGGCPRARLTCTGWTNFSVEPESATRVGVRDRCCESRSVRPAYRAETGGILPLRGSERLITQTRHFAVGRFSSPKPTPVGCDRKSEANPSITQRRETERRPRVWATIGASEGRACESVGSRATSEERRQLRPDRSKPLRNSG